MSNSKLVNYTLISPHKNSPRRDTIKKITIHHMAGNLSVETCGRLFNGTREASSNYGIGTDGRVGMYVEEKDRAWTSSSAENDNQAVTIEVANDVIGGNWHVSDKALAKLIELCIDICQRNNIKELIYTGDKHGNLTLHEMFKNTNCPGPYVKSKIPYIVSEVNKVLKGEVKLEEVKPTTSNKKSVEEIAREVVKGMWGNGDTRKKKLEAAGYNYSEVQKKVNELLNPANKNTTTSKPATTPTPAPATKPATTPTPAKKSVEEIAKEVLNGKWGNGEDRKKKLTAAGYNYAEVQKKVNELLNPANKNTTTSKPATSTTTTTTTSKPATTTPAKKSVEEIAKEVLNGKWGNGEDRKKKLEAAGYNYAEVQKKVNELANKKTTTTPAKKSVEEIAREVLNGKWGNGATRKSKLTAAGYNYAEVQKMVNKLAK